jgi:hypothetical protein
MRGLPPAVLARGFNRNGFPWPMRRVVFHGTAFVPEIQREGFKTREAGAPEMVGGRWTRSVSLTLNERRAAAIALGLETLIRGARRELSLVELLDRLHAEAPHALESGIVSGYDLQAVTFNKPAGQALFDLRRVLAKLDAGWTWFVQSGFGGDFPPPPGAIPVRPDFSEEYWLLPPGTPLPPRDVHGGRRDDRGYYSDALAVFFGTYRGVLNYCDYPKECFDPRFLGTRMERLAQRRPSSAGVLACRVHIPRVCTDARGAVGLGYVEPSAFQGSIVLSEMLQAAEHDCRCALEAQGEYDLNRAQRPLDVHRHSPPLGLWPIRDEGRRDRESTMLYHSGEEELVVYAPRRIEVLAVLSMPQIRARFGLGDRLTFPWSEQYVETREFRVVRQVAPRVLGRPIPKHLRRFRWYREHLAYLKREVGHDVGVDLPGVRPAKLYRYAADLRGLDLHGAHLRESYLRSVDFSSADLRGSDLSRSVLRGANFTGADLRGADLAGADLVDADFTGAKTDGMRISAVAVAQVPSLAMRRGLAVVEVPVIRGSWARRPTVPLGYHCTRGPITGTWSGRIQSTYATRVAGVLDALPYRFRDLLFEEEGIDVLPDEDMDEEARESWAASVLAFLARHHVEWIFVNDLPLSDTGAVGPRGGMRSAYGDYCYRVSLPPAALLGLIPDYAVAVTATAVLYDASVARPTLREVDPGKALPRIDPPAL